MKATELRIGNVVYNDYLQKNRFICGIFENEIWLSEDIESDTDQRSNIDCIQPIQLTEEILLKCEGYDKNYGFEITETTFLDFTIMGKWLYPYIIQEPEVSHLSTNCINLERIQYLHELQNLYHTLTKQELEINI